MICKPADKISWLRIIIFLFLTETYALGTQKNCLD